MGFTNSSLVNYTKISPNKNANRNHAIDTITIHCVVGQCSVETLGNIFAPAARQASSNYGIGYDGRIGMYVEEKDRSWCSSSASNDHRAVTIEVASDTTEPYAVNDKAYASLINLVTDICKRNGIKELKWKGDKSLVGQVDKQNMTVHRWFAATACPGTYLYNKMGDVAAKVNARLGASSESSVTSTIKVGDKVSIASNATYYSGNKIPAWVTKINWIVSEVNGDRAVIDKSVDGSHSICSPINVKFLTVIDTKKATTSTTTSTTTSINNAGNSTIKVGAKVSIASNATYYNGSKVPAWVTKKTWIVSEVNGDRAVIDKSTDGQNSICSPINVKFLTITSAAQAQPAASFESYLVKVTASALNIRQGAGTNYGITGCIRDYGVYTIVAESSGTGSNKGWGKLKSGAGWISLDFVNKI